MSRFLPSAADRVDEVMRRWPQTIRIFVRHGMACVGCSFGSHHTVEDAALEYGVGLARFLRELRGMAAFGRIDREPPVSASESQRILDGKEF